MAALDHHATSFHALVLYAFVGVLTGLAATAFIQGLHRSERLFDRIGNPYLRHVTGMLLVGVMFYSLFHNFGHYYIQGVGYATVQDVLFGGIQVAPLLVLLFACKLDATFLSLGSGPLAASFRRHFLWARPLELHSVPWQTRFSHHWD